MLSDADAQALGAPASTAFSFRPPVRGFADNLWRFDSATRIEFSATNAGTGSQVWFPRNCVMRVVAEGSEAVLELNREYEYKGGLWPVRDSPLQKK